MRARSPSLPSWSVGAASAILFVVGGHLAATSLIAATQAKHLTELSEVALRRAEAAVDYGVEMLHEIELKGLASCVPAALQSIRLQVYQRASVKDIRILNPEGSILCAAYSETLEFDQQWPGIHEMLPATGAPLRIFRLNQFFGVALGVARQIAAGYSLAAVLVINDALLDIMPSEVRDHSDVTLQLSNGQTIIRRVNSDSEEDVILATANSTRYPLQTIIRIERSALGGWNSEPYAPIVALSAGLGLAFGLLLGWAVSRPDSPGREIDKALAAGEFKPFAQPVFELASGKIVGCEILARWMRADGSVIPPSRFIPIAEATGRIEQMTWHMLTTALGGLKSVLRHDRGFKLSVNVVPHHLMSDGFVRDLRRIVGAAGVATRQIVLELTEREEITDLAKASAAVRHLRELGFGIAIDDVGIGHSGLSQIQALPANLLKIDKFFVDSIGRDAGATAIVEMLVRLARELKMRVVAEGIERREQLEALIECGVDQGQGYLVSPPLPLAQFQAFMAEAAAKAQDTTIRSVDAA